MHVSICVLLAKVVTTQITLYQRTMTTMRPAIGRMSLHDCSVQVSLPSLATFGSDGRASLEDVTLQAAGFRAREVAETYVGETVFLTVLVRGPKDFPHTREGLFYTLEKLGDVRIFLSSPENPPDRPGDSRDRSQRASNLSTQSIPGIPPTHSRSLPVLRESEWVAVDDPSAIAVPNAASPEPAARAALCKGLWILVRTPPEVSGLTDVLSIAGKQSLSVVLRERTAPSDAWVSRASVAISRASRMYGKPLALTASKSLMIHLPLDITCQQVVAGGSAAKSFVCIAARNSTDDATLSVVPPFIHISASKIVRDRRRGKQMSSLDDLLDPEDDLPTFDINTGTYLDEVYAFAPLFEQKQSSAKQLTSPHRVNERLSRRPSTKQGANCDNPTIDAVVAEEEDISGQESETSTSSDDDLGLFIPSFKSAQSRAITLGPREVFNFVYAIVPKGSVQRGNGEKTTDEDQSTSSSLAALPKLAAGTCFETSVAVAWSCNPRDTSEAAREALTNKKMLDRAYSSGGVLAMGERSRVAVRVTAVQWRPPALIEDVVITFAGPTSVPVRSQFSITVGILNQGKKHLNEATLFIQKGASNSGCRHLLTPLRTAISLGRVSARTSTRVELFCVALHCGTLSLGDVRVVDFGGGVDTKGSVWCAENSFEVFVVDADPETETPDEVPLVEIPTT